jgi:hypothetical protein
MKKTWTLACLLLPLAGVWGCSGEDASLATKGTEPAAIESREQALVSTWAKGCRGNALAVCADLVDPHYYSNHPSCQRNPICDGQYWPCDGACPVPTALETPTIRVVAAGKYTPSAALQIGYMWWAGGTGGFYTNSVNGAAISAPDSYRWSALTHGVGLNPPPSSLDATVECDTRSVSGTATSDILVRWVNGSTSYYGCDGGNSKQCKATIPVYGGFTATCNFVNG